MFFRTFGVWLEPDARLGLFGGPELAGVIAQRAGAFSSSCGARRAWPSVTSAPDEP